MLKMRKLVLVKPVASALVCHEYGIVCVSPEKA